jgi:hypothetical protein
MYVQLCAVAEAGETLFMQSAEHPEAIIALCLWMDENTETISPTIRTGWLERMRLWGLLWYAATFQWMERCWQVMVFFRGYTPPKAANGLGEGAGAGASAIKTSAVICLLYLQRAHLPEIQKAVFNPTAHHSLLPLAYRKTQLIRLQ